MKKQKDPVTFTPQIAALVIGYKHRWTPHLKIAVLKIIVEVTQGVSVNGF